jgi:hypothetical protein
MTLDWMSIDLSNIYKKSFNMSDRDIEFLKLKIKLYIVNEEYEKAAELKKWIIEMGGDPEIDNVEMLIEDINRRNGE